ncbi:MAG: hypothetical protein U0835_14195 [Isosphaeraceae bacterium]
MRSKDTAAALDRDDFDGEETDELGIEPSGADPTERAEDGDPDPAASSEFEPDEELLEAELGECDGFIVDDPDLDELDDNFDPSPEEIDDEYEITLIQELGIDLDAPDDLGPEIELGAALHDDDPVDDEVAA